MLCNQFSEFFDASGSSLELKAAPEKRYLPQPEIQPEIDTADIFPNPNDNNARGAWLVGNDSEVLEKRTEEIEKEEKLKAAEKEAEKAEKKTPFKKSESDEKEPADTENNSDEENSDDTGDDIDAGEDAEKAGEDILNIDEEVGEEDSGDSEAEPEEEPKSRRSAFSDMWNKKKAERDGEEEAEASDEE